MNPHVASGRRFRRGKVRWFLGLAVLVVGAPLAFPAAPPAEGETPTPLSLGGAVRWALENNPEIAALRQQRGIAAAGVVIADTYPFNPIWEASVRAAVGPPSAGITNSVSNQHRVFIDVECRGQGKFRRQAAGTALSRTEWEIAQQEVALAVRTLRAFDAVIYRFRKRQLVSDTVELNREAAGLVKELVKNGRLTAADLIVIRTEVQDARAQLGPGHASYVAAAHDFYRALGAVEGSFNLQGGLEIPPPLEAETDRLLLAALERRADLRARQLAVQEAEARLWLEVANRYGNVNAGPAYEYDPTRINLIGVQFAVPLPAFNTHRGEIQQREAERGRAVLDLRQTEVAVRQDVRAAAARLEQARKWADAYRNEIRPSMERALKDIRALFEARAAGADLLRVIDVQRKLLRARDTELDAVYELRQALADLALAVGDPAVAVGPGPAPP